MLRHLFDTYGGSVERTIPGNPKGMACSELMRLFEDSHLLDETLTAREVRMAVSYSKETVRDEIRDHFKAQTMRYVEFVEAVGRVSEMKDLSLLAETLSEEKERSAGFEKIATHLELDTSLCEDWRPFTGHFGRKLKV